MKNRRRAEYLPISNSKYEVYHNNYDSNRMSSIVLNADARDHSLLTGSHADIHYLQKLLYQLEGSDKKDGKYYDPEASAWKTALIPTLEKEIEEFETDFEKQKKAAALEGKELKTMPTGIFEKFLLTQARYDVFCEERDYLQEAINKIKNQAQETVKRNILRKGPRGAGKLLAGNLITMDGQKVGSVKVDRETILIIDEPTSPYHGMSVVDYRTHIVKSFIFTNQKLRNKIREDCIKNETFHERKLNAKPPLPEWPEGIKNYKSKHEEPTTIKRSKKK